MSLRAGANHPTHLPFIKRPPKPLLLGYQGGDADDETTRRRGALDITTHFIRVAFRRVVPVQRQRVNTLPRAGACSGDRLNTLPGVHRITPCEVRPACLLGDIKRRSQTKKSNSLYNIRLFPEVLEGWFEVQFDTGRPA